MFQYMFWPWLPPPSASASSPPLSILKKILQICCFTNFSISFLVWFGQNDKKCWLVNLHKSWRTVWKVVTDLMYDVQYLSPQFTWFSWIFVITPINYKLLSRLPPPKWSLGACLFTFAGDLSVLQLQGLREFPKPPRPKPLISHDLLLHLLLTFSFGSLRS